MVVHRSADAGYFDLHREDEFQIKRLTRPK
jgi:hypothetical protein